MVATLTKYPGKSRKPKSDGTGPVTTGACVQRDP